MRRLLLPLVCIAAVAGLAAGCGGGKKSTAPEIVKFDGPSAVSCSKTGQIQTVSFAYETKNATAVEPEIDGQPPGAQAGYDPHSGTMRFNYTCPGPHTLTISAFGKNNQSVSKDARVVPESGGGAAPAAAPQILKFKGPSVVPCGKKGEIKVVGFDYLTKNALTVEPEIDGQNPGAQAGYPAHSGTMTFAYVCPGPHTMSIFASSKGGKTVSKSARIVPSSSG